jgi:hypothetical protein
MEEFEFESDSDSKDQLAFKRYCGFKIENKVQKIKKNGHKFVLSLRPP